MLCPIYLFFVPMQIHQQINPAVSYTCSRVTQVEYISCNIGICDLPKLYALGPLVHMLVQ